MIVGKVLRLRNWLSLTKINLYLNLNLSLSLSLNLSLLRTKVLPQCHCKAIGRRFVLIMLNKKVKRCT